MWVSALASRFIDDRLAHRTFFCSFFFSRGSRVLRKPGVSSCVEFVLRTEKKLSYLFRFNMGHNQNVYRVLYVSEVSRANGLSVLSPPHGSRNLDAIMVRRVQDKTTGGYPFLYPPADFGIFPRGESCCVNSVKKRVVGG